MQPFLVICQTEHRPIHEYEDAQNGILDVLT